MYKLKILALAVSLLLAGPIAAQDDPNSPASKGFVMPGATPSQPTFVAAPSAVFKATVTPGKTSFAVGEPVQFKAKGNRDFYVYIISITPEGETQFLYPRQGDRPSRLKGGTEHTLPKGYNILVDEPGTEQVLVVSSLTPLDMGSARGIVTPGVAVGGGERQIDELAVEIVAHVGFPFTLKATPENAAVRVMNIGPRYQPGMQLAAGEYRLEVSATGYKTAKLTVNHGKDKQLHEVALESLSAAVAAPGTSPEIILSAEQQIYKNGEVVSVQYGASKAGWVHLYTYIGGELANVASKQVESGKFYTMKATATEPHGEQILVALWQEDEAVPAMTTANLKAELVEAATAKPAAGGTAQRALVISVETPLNYKTIPLVINP